MSEGVDSVDGKNKRRVESGNRFIISHSCYEEEHNENPKLLETRSAIAMNQVTTILWWMLLEGSRWREGTCDRETWMNLFESSKSTIIFSLLLIPTNLRTWIMTMDCSDYDMMNSRSMRRIFDRMPCLPSQEPGIYPFQRESAIHFQRHFLW